jgi:hypothetical protein
MNCEEIRHYLSSEKKGRLECVKETDTVQENGSSFSINNPAARSFCCLKVENCLINEGSRCDYLFVHSKFLFVELKSESNIGHSYNQITSSVRMLSKPFKMEKMNIEAYIVTNMTPKSANLMTRQFRAEFMRDWGRDLRFSGDGKMVVTI